MGDWDFLYEMHDRGCTASEIADAAGCGYAPWESLRLDGDWVDRELDEAAEDSEYRGEPESPFRSRDGYPRDFIEQGHVLQDLVGCAERHFANTGRYLQIWGELGEIYAEVKFGLRRHCTHHPGSDGTIDGALVEVKTISPEKSTSRVLVKHANAFEKLLIVRIDSNFNFKAKLFDRSELKGSGGRYLRGQF
ncbi:TPA: hypothetical protein QDZ10_001876 [Stenotrophomonas maltophilia]|nr:hypothetical protein [Stenotrophomonas maltophilia]